MLFMNDEVPDDGGREQARHGEDVGDGVDVFVGVEGGEEARGNSWTSASPGRVRLFPNDGHAEGSRRIGGAYAEGKERGVERVRSTVRSGACASVEAE